MKIGFKTNKIPIKELPNGDILNINVWRISSSKPGPTIYIQANMHGAEVQGNAVIHYLRDFFLNNESWKGEVLMVPYANPMGISSKSGTYTLGRFNPITGNNWNRNYVDFSDGIDRLFLKEMQIESEGDFKKFLQNQVDKKMADAKQYGLSDNLKLNLILQKLAFEADYVLDIHTGPIATEYIYAPMYAANSTQYLLFPNVILIPEAFAGAMDEAFFMPWFKYFKALDMSCPKESYTIEVGSEEVFDFTKGSEQAERILNYLAYKDVVERKEITNQIPFRSELENFKTYYAPCGGNLMYELGVGARFVAGQRLARMFKADGAIQDIKAHKEGILINRCPSSNVSEGMEILQVLEVSRNFVG